MQVPRTLSCTALIFQYHHRCQQSRASLWTKTLSVEARGHQVSSSPYQRCCTRIKHASQICPIVRFCNQNYSLNELRRIPGSTHLFYSPNLSQSHMVLGKSNVHCCFHPRFEWYRTWRKSLQSTTSHTAYTSKYYTITYTSVFQEVLGTSHCSQKLPSRASRHRRCNSHHFWQTEQHRKSETAPLRYYASNQPTNQQTKELTEGVDLRLCSSWWRIAGFSNTP